MKSECNRISLWLYPLRLACYSQAGNYFNALTLGGHSPFDSAQDDYCVWEDCCP